MASYRKGLAAATLGVVVNAVLAAVKIFTGVFGNSYALIADGIESLTDVFSSVVVWTGLKISSLPPDESHPYGHGKAESIAGLMVASALVVAALVIGYHSVREILTPHHAPAPFTLVVLAVVIVTKEILFRFVIRVGKELTSTAVQGDAWHHRSDAITSAAAFVGISIALVGGKGYESADDWAALLACAVILVNGWRFLRAALDELMDAALSPELRAAVEQEALRVPGVLGVDVCRVRKSGVGLFVDLQVRVDGEMTVRGADNIAEEVSRRLRASALRIGGVMVHVEPD